MNTIYIMNATILTNDGTYRMASADTTDKAIIALAKDMICHHTSNGLPIVSAIGHQSTADLASALLNMTIEVNRAMVSMGVGDVALCVKPKVRLEEGKVLTLDELIATPCSISIVTRVE